MAARDACEGLSSLWIRAIAGGRGCAQHFLPSVRQELRLRATKSEVSRQDCTCRMPPRRRWSYLPQPAARPAILLHVVCAMCYMQQCAVLGLRFCARVNACETLSGPLPRSCHPTECCHRLPGLPRAARPSERNMRQTEWAHKMGRNVRQVNAARPEAFV